MNCCNNPIIQDFSFRLSFDDRVDHKYCGRCHAHKFRGQIWTSAQWSAWINAVEECQDIVEFHGGGKLQDWDDMELLKSIIKGVANERPAINPADAFLEISAHVKARADD